MKTFPVYVIAALVGVAGLSGCGNQDAGQPPVGSISVNRPRSDDGQIKVSRHAKASPKRSPRKTRVALGKKS